MLFNSISYAVFIPIVFVLYWLLTFKNLKIQNFVLFISSYFFYASWDWRFMFLLLFSTLLDYYSGLKIVSTNNRNFKKIWLILSVTINIGFLGVFKYFNFFINSFASLIELFGLHVNTWSLAVILPVGISFYTFHGLSYILDVYYSRIDAEKNFIDYAVFVSFFPLLVAGPIERATHLLPQIKEKRYFDYDFAVDGLRQILWGLFKKIVIADNCAFFVDQIFESHQTLNGSTLLMGAILFAFQIYGDFSGYSDIAIGSAKLFGIRLLRNFNYPYFSRDIAEFWRRWHISLTTWFRDYIYIPIGGSRGSKIKVIKNTIFIFIISGFWHGANWTFILWGLYNALLFIPLLITGSHRKNRDTPALNRLLPNFVELISILSTFLLVVFGWILFRANDVNSALSLLSRIFSASLFKNIELSGFTSLIISVLIMFTVEWLQRFKQHGLEISHIKSRAVRWMGYLYILFLIFSLGGKSENFIYFQF